MSRVPFTRQGGPKPVGDMGVVVKAKDGVSFRQGLGQLATVTLREASDGNDGLRSSCFLQIARRQQRIDRVLLGRLDKTAGVDQHSIGLTWIGHQPEATAL